MERDYVVNNEETLHTLVQTVKAAQQKFASYTQEQVDKIFFEAAMAANKMRIPLAQMAVAWLLSRQAMTSVIVGPRTVEQLADNLQALRGTDFLEEELAEIDHILSAQ